jgi:hypothetical protein
MRGPRRAVGINRSWDWRTGARQRTTANRTLIGYWAYSAVAPRQRNANRHLTASGQAAGSARCWVLSPAEWLNDTVWRFSASDTTARATATAAYRPGAVTVTMLMILSARCALITLADLRHAARSAAAANARGSGG